MSILQVMTRDSGETLQEIIAARYYPVIKVNER